MFVPYAVRLRLLRERAGLSRDQLAKRMGLERGTSLQRYESDEAFGERPLPSPFLAKLARAVVGLGLPPIGTEDVWGLGDADLSVNDRPSAVLAVPIVDFASLSDEQVRVKDIIEIADHLHGELVAVHMENHEMALVAPQGALVVLDKADCDLRDGGRYFISWNGETILRKYRANPARFESESYRPIDTIFPTAAVRVFGRVIRVQQNFN